MTYVLVNFKRNNFFLPYSTVENEEFECYSDENKKYFSQKKTKFDTGLTLQFSVAPNFYVSGSKYIDIYIFHYIRIILLNQANILYKGIYAKLIYKGNEVKMFENS